MAVADRGWVLNRDEKRWELRGPDGERVYAYVTLEFLARTPQAGGRFPLLNRFLARSGLPRLTPGLAWWECVLVGGPANGRHEYLDPAAWDQPPPALCVEQEPPVPLAAGPDMPLHMKLPPPVVYALAAQGCGHGRACPYPYRWRG